MDIKTQCAQLGKQLTEKHHAPFFVVPESIYVALAPSPLVKGFKNDRLAQYIITPNDTTHSVIVKNGTL